jgi:G3E family GTPase
MIGVKIVTGFLGAGKTTFINALIKANPEVRYGIIENEFGQENIDSKLLLKSQLPIIEMTNGCICCSINDELYDALNLFYEKRDEFDELIIEATGIADPASIAEPFIINENVKRAFELQQIICLVDAEQIEDRLEDTKEAIQQIAFSNLILINKVDLIAGNYLVILKNALQEITPLAHIQDFNQNGPLSLPKVNFTSDFMPKAIERSNEKHTNFKSITISIDKSFQIHELHFRLIQFMLFQSKEIYRMKAIVYDEHYDAYIIQSVGKRVSIEKIDVPSLSNYVSKFVFIGKDIIREGLERMLLKFTLDLNQK